MILQIYANTILGRHTNHSECALIVSLGVIVCSVMPSGASKAQHQASECLAKSQPETVCLADWHLRRLYLQQPVEQTDLITTWNIHNASISGEGRQAERESWVQPDAFIGSLKPSHTCMRATKQMQTQSIAHPAYFLAGDVVSESSLVFQFQSSPQPRSNTRTGN